MKKYYVVLSPYSAYYVKDWQPIIINQFLISNVCKLVTKKEWLETWQHAGWRPVQAYGASNETPKQGDQVWSKALALSNYNAGEPIHLFKKIVLQPEDLSHISINQLNLLLFQEYIEDISTLIQPNLIFTNAK